MMGCELTCYGGCHFNEGSPFLGDSRPVVNEYEKKNCERYLSLAE